ncbi:hypothetical protein ASwh1_364 [Aeromonas phage Aswh_1]|nr:hypothetical protein ASwh1_364 [Aeromonas phage Aswh_1]
MNIQTVYESHKGSCVVELVAAIRDVPGVAYVPLTGSEDYFAFEDDSGTLTIYNNGYVMFSPVVN